jgi:Sulfatase
LALSGNNPALRAGAGWRSSEPPALLLKASAGLLRLSESLALTRIARLAAVALILLTGVFFLLSSFTFSWLNIVRNDNVLWIAQLGNMYAGLYWAVFALNAITLIPSFYHGRARWWTEAFLILLAAIGMALSRVYHYYYLPLSFSNVGWSVVTTLPLAGLGLHDIAIFGDRDLWRRATVRKTMPVGAAFLLGIFVAAWYFTIAISSHGVASGNWFFAAILFVLSALLHGLFFAAMFVLFSLAEELTERARWDARLQFVLSLALVWMIASLLLRQLVTPAFSFNNGWADAWSGAYPFAFIVLLAGWHIRRSALQREGAPRSVEAVVSDLMPRGRAWSIFAFAAALLGAVAIPLAIERVDWNFLFQRLTAVAVWTVIGAMAWRWFARPINSLPIWRRSALCILCIAGGMLLAQCNRTWHSWGLKSLSRTAAAYAGTDPSFQVMNLAFRLPIQDGDRTGLFLYLQRSALIADPLRPPRIKVVDSLSRSAGPHPNIYLIVIDTLRRDYLSPYNPRVTFTPQIEAFAKDSFVFQHAYTNYGGTALSEPAIWAGMMIPSKHYVQPFSEMNLLEQLTEADGHRRAITRDMILSRLLRRFPGDIDLNRAQGRQYFGIDFRDAVRELISLPPSSDGAPTFVYTQPQNLHPITLQEVSHSGKPVGGKYPGFNPRYADELKKVDEAFGLLIDDLKKKGEYENSIVVLTSDHGDWLGEYGRWGHGQSLLPPIIEVPLLIHLPESLGSGMYCNRNQMVFLTDIAPTLSYLLGHRNLRSGELYGRPLFTETADEQAGYARPYHLFVSAYAPVFALLDETTQELYVADAVDKNQSLYNLSEDHDGLSNNLDRSSQSKFEHLLRAHIDRLNALYGYSAQR